ncbi:uncharacterized protein TNIN_336311, partial [Trichonephila inaurata madagascariensis]
MFLTTNKTTSNDQKCSQLSLVEKLRKYVSPKNYPIEVRETFRVHNSPDNFVLNNYSLLFRLLYLVGIKVTDYAESKKKNNAEEREAKNVKQRLVRCCENILKYFVFSVLYSRNLIAVLLLIFVKVTKTDVIRVFQSVLFSVIYTLIYKKRREILRISKGIGCIYRQLPNCNFKKKNYHLTGVLVFVLIILIIRFTLLFGISENNEVFRKKFYKLFSETNEHPMSFILLFCLVLLLFVIESLSYIIAFIALSIFVTYYSLTCSFIRDVFKCLLIQMHGAVSSNELKKVHYIYEGIMKMLNDMDSTFSLLAFLTVLFNTFGLFWDVCRIAFYENETSGYLLFTLSAISYLALLLMLMISGFASNEQANIVKVHMLCLPHETAENQSKMNFNKKTLLQDNVLTLWKIYVLDRSLVIA